MSERQATWAKVLDVPRAFVYGLLGGAIGPLLALGLATGVIYAATGQLPAAREVQQSDGTRHGAIVLATPLEARASWARYGGDLRGAMLELRASLRSEDE
ncbi:MAG: hypothetical protein JXA09_07980 [Anaerolineae bacterium]|nr:hypothetical protein [Anaerolineae bacterium]